MMIGGHSLTTDFIRPKFFATDCTDSHGFFKSIGENL